MGSTNNVPNIPLGEIYIGDVDGRDEAQRGNFEKIFYKDNKKYEEIKGQNKFIICGRKGTGKTILAHFIKKQSLLEKEKICEVRDLNNFNLQKLNDIGNRDLSPMEFDLFWKRVILIELAKLAIDRHNIKSNIPLSSHNKLKRYLYKKYGKLNDTYKIIEKIIKKSKISQSDLGVESHKGKKFFGKQADRREQEYSNKCVPKEYYNDLEQLERLVMQVLGKSYAITLIYDDLDELDELDDKINQSKFYRSLIIDLIKTVKEINYSLKEKIDKETKIILAIRSDILDSLQWHATNLNRIASDSIVDLQWIDTDYKSIKHPLMDLILTKIKNSVPEFNSLSKQAIFNRMFPHKIEGKEVIKYLSDYSFGRPRDVIKYLGIIKNRFPNEFCFRAEFFIECKQEYSNWFFNELINELYIHEEKGFIEDCISLVSQHKKSVFRLSDLENYYDKYKEQYPNIKNLKEVINILYKYGIIGNSWPKSRKRNLTPKDKKDSANNYNYSWAYRPDASDKPNYSQTFVIHNGLKRKFSV